MAAPADGTVAIDVSASDVELSSRSPKPTQPSPAVEAAEVEVAEAAIDDAAEVAAVAASSAEAGGAGAGAGAGSEGLRKRTSSTGRDEAWVDPLANLRSTRNLTLQPTPGVLLEWNHLSYEVVTQGKRSYANDPTAQEIEPSKCKASCKRACGPLPCARRINARRFKKQILNDVSGFVRPGELVAVMGASGAGKSTLLNILARRNTNNTGDVLLNNKPFTNNMKAMTAYVQQEDLLMGTLTVRETLRYQAELRMDPSMSKEDKYKHVDKLINSLSLNKCAEQMVGALTQGLTRGISGGERKRLAFAAEILTDPALLFADEPTSGLDSYMAESVVRMLKQLALNGRSIVATIHQPSSEVYALFDRVCFLSEGRVAYFGSREGALEHFASLGYTCPPQFNPADYFIDVLAFTPSEDATPEAQHAHFVKQHERVSAVANQWNKLHPGGLKLETAERTQILNSDGMAKQIKTATYKTGFCTQLTVLTRRAFTAESRDAVLTRARFGQSVILAILLGLMYVRLDNDAQVVQNKSGVIFFILINQSMLGTFGVLQTFPLEKPIFQREHENGNYSVGSYYLSKVFSSIPSQIFFPVLFIAIAYWIVGIRDEFDVFLAFCGVVVLVSNVSLSLGYAISSAVPSVQVALALGPMLLLPFLLFGGFFLNIESIPSYFKWLETISFFKYGFSALSILVWGGLNDIGGGCGQNADPAPGSSEPGGAVGTRSVCLTGTKVLSNLGFDEDDLLRDVLVLAGMVVAFRVLAFVCLWLVSRKKQNE